MDQSEETSGRPASVLEMVFTPQLWKAAGLQHKQLSVSRSVFFPEASDQPSTSQAGRLHSHEQAPLHKKQRGARHYRDAAVVDTLHNSIHLKKRSSSSGGSSKTQARYDDDLCEAFPAELDCERPQDCSAISLEQLTRCLSKGPRSSRKRIGDLQQFALHFSYVSGLPLECKAGRASSSTSSLACSDASSGGAPVAVGGCSPKHQPYSPSSPLSDGMF